MAIKNKCKYCLAPLDKDGYCTNCSIGKLLKRLAKVKKKKEISYNKSHVKA